MRVRWEGPGDTGESAPGARVMRKYTSTARRVMRRGHRQMPRDSRVLAHLVTDHLSRDKTPEPWTSAWQRKRDTWHREFVTSETINIKLKTVTTRRRMVWRWVIIICHARYLFLEFNSSAQFKLSKCTSYKTVQLPQRYESRFHSCCNGEKYSMQGGWHCNIFGFDFTTFYRLKNSL